MSKIVLSAMLFLSTIAAPCNRSSSDANQTPEDLFTEHTWLVKELTYLQQGQLNYYKRDSYSDQFQNDRIAFKKGGSGIYTNTYNQEFNTTWKYEDKENTKVELVIKNYAEGGPAEGRNQVIHLENVTVTDKSLRYTEIYVSNRRATMTSVYRIPAER